MIYPGSDLKFKVEASVPGFSMSSDDFTLAVRNRWGQLMMSVSRIDMQRDNSGNFFISMKDVPEGTYYGTLTAKVKDGDFPDGIRKTNVTALLCCVGGTSSAGFSESSYEEGGTWLRFERVWFVSPLDSSPMDGEAVRAIVREELGDSVRSIIREELDDSVRSIIREEGVAADSVDSEAIKDGSIRTEDLSEEVREKLKDGTAALTEEDRATIDESRELLESLGSGIGQQAAEVLVADIIAAVENG